MGRSTAKERLRVAHELARRPLLAAALAAGDVSYAKARAMTRVVGADEATDRSLLAVAAVGTACDLERLARHHELLADQDRPDRVDATRSCLRSYRRFDGMVVTEIVQRPEDAERFHRILDAYVESANSQLSPVDEAPAGAPAPPGPPPSWGQRRADALVDVVEAGAAHLAEHHVISAERARVDVLVDYDRLVTAAGTGLAELAGGAPLSGDAARRLACDAGISRILTRGPSQVLDVGRLTRHWTAPQRRAILARHDHRCAVAGCERKVLEIHHIDPWSSGGRTDLHLGIPLCFGHHQLVHEGGWTIAYDPTSGSTALTGPQGQDIRSIAKRALVAA